MADVEGDRLSLSDEESQSLSPPMNPEMQARLGQTSLIGMPTQSEGEPEPRAWGPTESQR